VAGKARPGPAPAPAEHTARVSLSEVVRAQLEILSRRPREHSLVGLSRNARGMTQIAVEVRTGELGADTIGEAAELARKLYDELAAQYPYVAGGE
jgi:hypothetical protein